MSVRSFLHKIKSYAHLRICEKQLWGYMWHRLPIYVANKCGRYTYIPSRPSTEYSSWTKLTYHAPQNMASFVVLWPLHVLSWFTELFLSWVNQPAIDEQPHGRYLQHFLPTFSGICDKKKKLHLKVVVHGGPKIVMHLVDIFTNPIPPNLRFFMAFEVSPPCCLALGHASG